MDNPFLGSRCILGRRDNVQPTVHRAFSSLHKEPLCVLRKPSVLSHSLASAPGPSQISYMSNRECEGTALTVADPVSADVLLKEKNPLHILSSCGHTRRIVGTFSPCLPGSGILPLLFYGHQALDQWTPWPSPRS